MAASESGAHLDAKIFVDNVKSKVVFAEVDNNFVDVLFSFLTLPLGTIVKLIGKTKSEPATVGCFNSLYQSVMNFGNEHFCAEEFKDMLLNPRSYSEAFCQELKININDTKLKYFICSNYSSCAKFVSMYQNTRCPNCNVLMRTVETPESSTCSSKVFVTKASKFIITDDLQVSPVVVGTVMGILNNLNIDNLGVLEERTLKLGLNELLELLKLTLLSTTPLTDLFVSKKKMDENYFPNKLSLENRDCNDHSEENKKINVKVMLKKSSKDVLFVEADQDFVDFLFSLLIIPLGEMLHIMGGQSFSGCIDSLYKSALSLDSKYFISEHKKNFLIRPKLTPHFDRKIHLFSPETTSFISFRYGVARQMPVDCKLHTVAEDSGGFLRDGSVFYVLDNLEVMPFSAACPISILKRNKVSFSDVEERTLSLGTAEGISILRAALNSSSAITNGLLRNSLIFKKPKQEK